MSRGNSLFWKQIRQETKARTKEESSVQQCVMGPHYRIKKQLLANF